MKGFPWRAGMKRLCRPEQFDRVLEVAITTDGAVWLCLATDALGVVEHGEAPLEWSPWGWVKGSETDPDPNDGATKGALLDVVRELWGFPDLYPRRVVTKRPPGTWGHGPWPSQDPFSEGWGFFVGCVKGDELGRRVGIQPTEFAALLAAYQESP